LLAQAKRFMKTIRPFLFLYVLLVSTGSFAQNRDISYMSAGGKLRPLQAIMDIRHYTLALDVNIPKKSIEGYCEIDLLLSKATDTLLFDLVHLLRVSKITVDKNNAAFAQKGDSIFIVNNNSGIRKASIPSASITAANRPLPLSHRGRADSPGQPTKQATPGW
jgi:aminopeptidase N